MDKTVQWVTTASPEIWRAYGRKTVKTWQHQPRIVWDQELQQDRKWQQWRERNRLRPQDRLRRAWLKFSWKAQLMVILLRLSTKDHLIYQDLDVTQHTDYSPEFYQLLAHTECIAIMRRPQLYTETGWISINTEHPERFKLADCIEDYYLTDRIFDQEWWHDAHILDLALRDTNVSHRDLAKGQGRGTVLLQTPLRQWIEHRKGDRKYQWAGECASV